MFFFASCRDNGTAASFAVWLRADAALARETLFVKREEIERDAFYNLCSNSAPCSFSQSFAVSVIGCCDLTIFQKRGVWFGSIR
ncbi:hypothetical protein Thiofri_03321 [Thiorhodovibrio frisius]|nr:hypothetical protein Thiofri_03321 [Thiorhodovibrio frisius]